MSRTKAPIRSNLIRQGFTLVELLVVMVVIVILGALVAGVVVKGIDAIRTTNSTTTIEIVSNALSAQLKEITERAVKSGKERDKIKEAVEQAFPNTWEEVFSKGYLPYQRYLTQNKDAFKSLKPNEQSSVLLRMILEKGPNGHLDVDQLPKGAVAPIKGMDALVDSWGDPIQYRVDFTVDPVLKFSKPKFTVTSDNVAVKN